MPHAIVATTGLIHARLQARWCLRWPNGRAFSGEPSERSERPERMRGRRVRCNAMLAGCISKACVNGLQVRKYSAEALNEVVDCPDDARKIDEVDPPSIMLGFVNLRHRT